MLIEDCLKICANELTRGIRAPGAAFHDLVYPGGLKVRAHVTLEEDKRGLAILHYLWRTPTDMEPVRMEIGLVMQSGALPRWFFQCPLDVNGKPCRRWAGKLYIARSRWFGCRLCQSLEYLSASKLRAKKLAESPEELKKALRQAKSLGDKKALVDAYLIRRRAAEKKFK